MAPPGPLPWIPHRHVLNKNENIIDAGYWVLPKHRKKYFPARKTNLYLSQKLVAVKRKKLPTLKTCKLDPAKNFVIVDLIYTARLKNGTHFSCLRKSSKRVECSNEFMFHSLRDSMRTAATPPGGTWYIPGWGGAARSLIPWPCLRQISLIFLPCLRQNSDFWYPV